jgi:hypothetical protein
MRAPALFNAQEYKAIAARGYASRGLPMALFILDRLSGQNAPLIPGLFERAVIASTKES